MVAATRVPDEIRRFGEISWKIIGVENDRPGYPWLATPSAPGSVVAPWERDYTYSFSADAARAPSTAISDLPNLRLGMVWRNGASSGVPRGSINQVTVDMGRFGRAQHAVVDPLTVLPRKTYSVGDLPDRCWCRMVPLVDGSELIVPTFELLRAMYFLHPEFIPASVGGAIDAPDLISPGLLPWFPDETRRLSADEVQIAFPRRISSDLAKVLAGIIFSPPAADGLSYLAKHFRRGKLAEKSFMFPPIVHFAWCTLDAVG